MCDLADARRRAEEALRRHDTAHWSERGSEDNVYPCITALRALLAALPGEGAEGPLPEYGPCPYYRNGEPHSNCEVCGGLGALPILPVDILAPQSPEVAAKGRCEDCDGAGYLAYPTREPKCDRCNGTGEAPAPQTAPTTDASILPVCLDCSFASGGHVHVNREDGSQAVRYPTPEEWNAALRSRPLPPEVEAAAEALHPYADWHEDDGPVLWYAVPVEEPPYCGEPLCSDWPNEWNAPYDTVTGAFIDGPYAGKILKWQRLPVLPPDAALSSARGAKGGE